MADSVNRQIPWLRVFVEGVVIVGSILMAFGIEAWWDRTQERALAIENLESILGEFEGNLEELPRIIGQHRRLVSTLSEVHRLLSEAETGALVEVPDTLLARSVLNISFEPQEAALSALIQSGDLQRIRNVVLREALAGWPSRVADAIENEFMLNRDHRPPYLDLIAPQVDVSRIVGVFAGDAAMESMGTLALRSTPELLSRLTMLVAFSARAIIEEQELLVEGDSVIALLHQELRR